MIKLVATDVDGTLVKAASTTINPEYFEVIRQLRRAGIEVVICSGRQEEGLTKLFAPVVDECFFVSNNGSSISRNGKMLLDDGIDHETVSQIINDVSGLPDCNFFFSNARGGYYMPGVDPEDLAYSQSYGHEFAPFPGLDKCGVIAKMCVHCTKRTPHPAAALVGKYEGATVVDAGGGWMDFIPKGINKGTAVKLIQERLGISHEETLASGDQENDVAMLKAAGISYAVATASEVCKAAAGNICPGYEDNGVLNIWKSLI